ncbi:TPA: alpha/beta hydrolase [Pseudomonas aeruginosa]
MYSALNRIILAAGALLAISGCASNVNLKEISSGSSLHPEVLPSPTYNIQALVPAGTRYRTLRVYIEGDGHAWATRTQPSTDPTPHTSLMAQFAADDPAPAAYLARPCQFVVTGACKPALWTSERFGRASIDAMNSALNNLKSRYRTESFELVGYSGGAAIALILAAERDDVGQVQTIAGNVDPVTWTKLKNITPLLGSLSPLEYSARLAGIPQRHLIGQSDEVVPAEVVRAYSLQVQAKCLSTVVVPGASHDRGYADAWRAVRDLPFNCDMSGSPRSSMAE